MSAFSSPRTLLLIQDECYKHRYIRTKDDSFIVERPQRLRALKLGFAAAISRLEHLGAPADVKKSIASTQLDPGVTELANALDTLSLSTNTANSIARVCEVSHHPVTLQYLSADPAVRMIHAANAEGDGFNNLEHLDRIAKWARESEDRIKKGECEIPIGFPQNDLYMCPKSYRAICGAVDTVREAVDRAMRAPDGGTRAVFAAIRPPGHHCGEDVPGGFCFVNNIAIGAAHAYLQHKVKRVIIFDIDLHHGNGTQAIAWSINAETHRNRLAELATQQMHASGVDTTSHPTKPPGLQIFYASLHDILSFPCEDGDPTLVRDASVSISGLHGQFIENVHLQPYTTHQDFWERLYPQYQKLFAKALEFLQLDPEDKNVPVFISCGFDASELEYESMSRHGRKVPVGFYYRFTKEAKEFASKHANGRVISVLEGGYSDQTLMAGGIAHLVGLVENGDASPSGPEEWWSEKNLEMLDKASKKRKGRQSIGTISEPWLERAIEILASLDPYNGQAPPSPSGSRKPVVALEKALGSTGKNVRERKKPRTPPSETLPVASTAARPRKSNSTVAPSPRAKDKSLERGHEESGGPIALPKHDDDEAGRVVGGGAKDAAPSGLGVESEAPIRKLPRLILRVREPGT